MGHVLRPALVGLHALARHEREHRWVAAMDAGLVLAALACVALRGALASHPTLSAVIAAVVVGTIVHRVLVLTGSPDPRGPGERTGDSSHPARHPAR